MTHEPIFSEERFGYCRAAIANSSRELYEKMLRLAKDYSCGPHKGDEIMLAVWASHLVSMFWVKLNDAFPWLKPVKMEMLEAMLVELHEMAEEV